MRLFSIVRKLGFLCKRAQKSAPMRLEKFKTTTPWYAKYFLHTLHVVCELVKHTLSFMFVIATRPRPQCVLILYKHYLTVYSKVLFMQESTKTYFSPTTIWGQHKEGSAEDTFLPHTGNTSIPQLHFTVPVTELGQYLVHVFAVRIGGKCEGKS